VSAPPGRRERKKQLTRQAISDVATALFLQRGFDAVTIAEIAAAADVAVQTVFNHFRSKEDLFFDDQAWVTGPTEAIRAAPDAPVRQVLEAYHRAGLEKLRDRGHLPTAAQFNRTIEASPALRARRAQLADEMQDALVRELGDGSASWRSRLLAAQFHAVQKVLGAELVRRLDEHDDPEAVLAGLSPVIDEAFRVLDRRPDTRT
jgi:AcrR family transcriptional regulator